MLKQLIPLLALVTLTGWEDPRECWLGIAHRDCVEEGGSLMDFPHQATVPQFPQDDAICREYGLRPGTHAYDVCRQKKREMRQITRHETDRGVFQGPFTPDPPP